MVLPLASAIVCTAESAGTYQYSLEPELAFPMTRSGTRAYAAVVRSRDPRAETKMRAALDRAGTPKSLELMAFDAYLARALAPDRLIARLAGACGLASLALAYHRPR